MKTLAFALALTIACTASVQAGSLSQKEVAADAKWLVHLDLENLRHSKLGSFLTKEFLEKHLDQKLGELKAQLNASLDLDLKKIASITAYGTDYQKKPEANGVLLIQTGQNVEKIVDSLLGALFAAIPDEAARPVKKLQQEPFVGYAVGNDDLFASIHNQTVLLLGKSRAQIEKARNVLLGKAPNLVGNNAFSGYPKLENSFFFLGIAEAFNDTANIPPQAKVLQMADGGRLVLGEKKDHLFLNLALRTKTQEISNQIHSVVAGLIAFAALSQTDNQELQQLAQSIKVTNQNNLVTVNLEYPVAAALEKLTQMNPKAKVKPQKLEEEAPAKAKPEKPKP